VDTKTQATGEYHLQESETSEVWELATEATTLKGAETVDLANLLLTGPRPVAGPHPVVFGEECGTTRTPPWPSTARLALL
jgi:hypothetical protein